VNFFGQNIEREKQELSFLRKKIIEVPRRILHWKTLREPQTSQISTAQMQVRFSRASLLFHVGKRIEKIADSVKTNFVIFSKKLPNFFYFVILFVSFFVKFFSNSII
jgi:hypothetical protein